VRRGLRSDENVMRLLEENERSVLISALLNRMYEEDDAPPDEQAVMTYYEQNKDRLRLTEPFVRIRYLVTASADSAQAAIDELSATRNSGNPDSLWAVIAESYSVDPDGASLLSDSFYPEARIFASIPGLNEAIERLEPGQTLSPFEYEGRYHVVQLVERLPVGALPERALLEDQLRDRIAIENRKQLYARQVQRLRNEALAREDLVIR
jgi:parvulin-like peptidyl-prolyl isomerase